MAPWLTIVGIGEDGWPGLGREARRAVLAARTLFGGARHLDLLPARVGGRRFAWPAPFSIEAVLEYRGKHDERVCVLASGDPMFFGVGTTFARHLSPEEFTVIPAPSSVSLAAARLHWPLQESATVSLVGRDIDAMRAFVRHGARLFVLGNDGSSPANVAAWLDTRGYGASRMTVFEHLGGVKERRVESMASEWGRAQENASVAALNLITLECIGESFPLELPFTPGLPDDAYQHDGQLTKRDVRAITLSRLAPSRDELLWDVGAGCGSIGIEWMRSHASCRAIAIEHDEGRQRFIEANRVALGVPALHLVKGRAPDALAMLDVPDAVFIGGGLTIPGVVDTCWQRLKPGGRLIANAVTVQSEALLTHWREQHGGELIRLGIAHAQPLGRFDTWRQALPITLLHATKP